ncbi:MAG: response regulator transcription factor [Lachnospiraceae bacterium]|nr:response regulator transcription factor [Lachnospiraceae bacterium]
MYQILLCDDEEDILYALKIYLRNSDYRFFEAHTGKEALEVMRNEEIDLVLMDIMMPEMDGITALEEIRKFSNVPVLFLTAKGEEMDKIIGLGEGADDYITKPFNPMEVAARVKSHLRRYTVFGGSKARSHSLRIGGIEMDDDRKHVLLDGEEINLTPTEYQILKLFLEHPGKVFPPAEIYTYVWKEEGTIGSEGTVAVHIRHLREKLEINPAEPRYIKVIWGQGYLMEEG